MAYHRFISRRPLYDVVALFLLGNFIAHLAVLHSFGLDICALVLAVACSVLFLFRWPDLVGCFCLFLGISFPLYCFQAYTVHSQVFEFLIVVLGLLLWLRLRTGGSARFLNRDIAALLFACVLLALTSLALFPVGAMTRLFTLWGFVDFSSAVFTAPPENPLYALAAGDRLLLFASVILLLSSHGDGRSCYRRLFQGAAVGGVLAACLGVLNQFGLVDLSWYRPQFLDPSGVPRLHSITGNPGWFAQYLIGSFPFIILQPWARLPMMIRRFGRVFFFLLCGAALLLTGSRTSWLIFPVVGSLCAIASILQADYSFGRSTGVIARVVVRSLLLLFLVVLVSTGLLFTTTQKEASKKTVVGNPRIEYLVQRMRHVFNPGERSRLWRQSLVLGWESPVFGLGYEGFKWHQKIMASVPESNFARHRQTANMWDTPHNLPLQLFISNGVAGLILWALLFASVLMVLWHELRHSNSRFAAAVLISMVSLLLYGLTQSLLYIPMIWFLFLLTIGYGLTVPHSILPHRLRYLRAPFLAVVFLIVLSGSGYYFVNAQSQNLARKYGMTVYSDDREAVQYAGFYPREDWGDDGVFRWSGPRAEIRLPRGGMVGFTLVCNTPNLGDDPVVLDVTVNNHPLDRYTFWDAGKVNRTYFFPSVEGHAVNTIVFSISRTWSPRLAGVGADTRNLGIAVSEPRLLDPSSVREAGFSRVEFDDDEGRVQFYRWTGQCAWLDPGEYGPGALHLFLMGEQPYLDKEPLSVRLIQNGNELGIVRLAGPDWNDVVLPGNLQRNRLLMILVSRTWNSRKAGYGDDGRDLGVAVAPLPLMR